MDNPTHALVDRKGAVVALFRCYKNGRTEAVYCSIRSASYSSALQNDLLAGQYKMPMIYLYGYVPDAIPEGCKVVEYKKREKHNEFNSQRSNKNHL